MKRGRNLFEKLEVECGPGTTELTCQDVPDDKQCIKHFLREKEWIIEDEDKKPGSIREDKARNIFSEISCSEQEYNLKVENSYNFGNTELKMYDDKKDFSLDVPQEEIHMDCKCGISLVNEDVCDNTIKAEDIKANLKEHNDVAHLQIKKFSCVLCAFSSASTHNLKTHVERVHGKLGKLSCHLCEYSSYYDSNLKRHIDVVHLQIKKFCCDLCGFSSAYNQNLKKHIKKVHDTDEKFNFCQLCEFKAYNENYLKKHMDAVHLQITF